MKSPSAVPLRSRALRTALGFVACVAALAELPAADWQGLLSNSPFGQPPQVAPQNTSGELEFRGVVREEDVTLVNIFNTATQKSHWIPLKGQTNGIAADAYDDASDKLQVTMGGKTLTLGLKQSRVTLVQAPVAPPPPPPGSGNQPVAMAGQSQTAQGSPAGADAQQAFRNLPPEARSMIDEIRRRRALRSQQAQQTPAGNQPAVQPAQPVNAPNSQP